jgi:peptide/nickel transport system permease protein
MATATADASVTPALAADRPSARRWLARHPFVAYAVRRFFIYLLTMWGALSVAFIFYRLIPGDPILSFMASLEQQYGFQQSASHEIIDHYREVFGLNGNLFQQYVRYFYQMIVTRDLGPSLIDFPTPAQQVIARSLPWTIGLLGLSVAISWFIGIFLGALAAWKRNSPLSQLMTNVALSFAFVPGYFIALMALFIFAYRLAWFPISAAYDPHFDKGFNWDFIRSVIEHGTLPAFSIAFGFVCRDLLSARMLVITTLGEDYLTFAEAKGLKPIAVMLRYALRNVYMPQVTALAIQLGFIFNGAIIIENVFNYPGVGTLLVSAIRILDFNTVQGIISMSIVGVLTANFLVDLILPLLDPRVKYWR